MLSVTVIKVDGRLTGHKAQFNHRLKPKSHRLAGTAYEQILLVNPDAYVIERPYCGIRAR
jgi:hypothetical protein